MTEQVADELLAIDAGIDDEGTHEEGVPAR